MKKVLWITSMPLNSIARKFGINESVYGGWLEGISSNLVSSKKVNLYYLFITNTKNFEIKNLENIIFIEFGQLEYRANIKKLNTYIGNEQIELLHLFGTENKQLNYIFKNVKRVKKVISLQGIISEYYKYFDIKLYENLKYLSKLIQPFFYLLSKTNKFLFYWRSFSEKKVINSTFNVIGRTDWDKKSVLKLNKELHYFKCNEILRKEFYTNEVWEEKNFNPYRLIVSQGNYAIKGLHFLLYAVYELKKEYSNIELIVCGEDITKNNSIFSKLGFSYSNLIINMIEILELNNQVKFVGPQNPVKLKKILLSSNIFVIPSTIENSPNSLAEAMMLGVPVICSDVGGIPSLTKANINCLVFPLGNKTKLIEQIKMIFDNKIDIRKITRQSIIDANIIYNQKNNIEALLKIYGNLI